MRARIDSHSRRRRDRGSSRIALRSIRAPGYCRARLRASLARPTVGALVLDMAGVAAQPMPMHFMVPQRRVEPLPQVDVADRLLVGGAPAVLLPGVDAFGDAAAQVLAVGIELDDARAFERLERRNGGGELHAVVGGMRLGALELALVPVPGEHCAPAARPRVAGAGAVGVNDHVPRAQCEAPQMNP